MSRGHAHLRQGHQRTPLALTVVLLVLLCLLPARWLTWVSWFAGLADTAIIPVQAPVRNAAAWLAGRVSAGDADSPELAAAREEAERSRTLYLQTLEEVSVLREQVEALQSGRALSPGLMGMAQLVAPVLGEQQAGAGRVLKVRAGRSQGVVAGDPVTFRGVHLVGRVVGDVDLHFSRVQVITDKAAGNAAGPDRGRINGVIILGETDGRLPPDPMAERVQCLLTPTGDGRLSGDVAGWSARADRSQPRVEIGAIVRLSDERWPASAQMLVLGRVEREDTKPNQRQTIVVTPLFDPAKIREVIVRASGEVASGGGGGVP